MKTEKHCLILVVFAGILCVPAWGGVECLSPEYMPILPDISESAGIWVETSFCKDIDGLIWGELHEKVLQKVIKAGIKRYSNPIRGNPMHLPMPTLRIDVDILRLDDSQQYIIRIQTSLAVEVSLANESKRKADIWWTEPTMQAVSIEEMPAKVTEVVLQQVDRFIKSYLEVNPPNKRSSNASDANIVPKEQLK